MDRLLIDYLPHVVREYDVYKALTTGEQPEFELVWDRTDLAYNNQFIDSADAYGLSRWERILQIYPRATDTLESRRLAIKVKLNTVIPYTIRVLIQSLEAISEGQPFSVYIERGSYLLELVTQWENLGQMEHLRDILEQMVPVNMAISSTNQITAQPESVLHIASALSFCEVIGLSDSGTVNLSISSSMAVPGVPALCESIGLSDAGQDRLDLASGTNIPGLITVADCCSISDAAERLDFGLTGTVQPMNGVAFTEYINI